MHFDIFTLFPGMFQGPLTKASSNAHRSVGLLSIALHNIRDATTDKHHIVDDYPYGGGAGMVMKPEPFCLRRGRLSKRPDYPAHPAGAAV